MQQLLERAAAFQPGTGKAHHARFGRPGAIECGRHIGGARHARAPLTPWTLLLRALAALAVAVLISTLPAAAQTVPTAPSAPENLAGTPGDREVELVWEAPASDGGSAVTGYEYRHAEGVSVPEATPWQSAGASLTATVGSLTNGTAYAFEVRAVNDAAEGEAAATTATPGLPPSAPQNLAATPGDREVELVWEAPSDDGGAAVVRYDVRHAEGASVPSDTPWTAVGGTAHTVSGLTNGTAYAFEVRAVNDAAEGEAATTTATPGLPPSAPQNLAGTPGDREVELGWEAPSDDGGAAIVRYDVRHAEGASVPDDTPWTPVEDTSHTVSGLTNGTAYAFEVRAVNDAAKGEAATTTATPVTVPSAPRDVLVTTEDRGIVLRWSPPADNGGSIVLRYEMRHAEGASVPGDTRWRSIGASTSGAFRQLTNGTAYAFEVRAVNARGEGPAAHTQATPGFPSAPQNLALAPSHNAVALAWEAPSGDGGSALTKYQYRVSEDSGSTWTPDWTDIADSGPGGTHSTSYEVTGLDPETEYSFELRAVNANGEGAAVADTTTTLRESGTYPTVTISAQRGAFGLGIDFVSFTLTRTGAVDETLTVPVTLVQDDAYLGADALERSVTFDANAESADLAISPHEFLATATQSGDLMASVAAGDGFVVGTPSAATVEMVVADPAMTARIEDASYRFSEGRDTTNIVVLLRTAAGLPRPNAQYVVSLSSESVSQGASPSDDYAVLSQSVSFASGDFEPDGDAWQARKEMALSIVDDNADEADETLNLRLQRGPGLQRLRRVALVEADGQTDCGGSCVVPVTIVDDDGTPSAPHSLTLTPSHNAVALGWEAPSDDGGNAVTKYQFQVSEDGGTTWTPDWTDIADSGPGGTHSTSYEVNGLNPETEYSFELRAVNANGEGAAVADTATTLRKPRVPEIEVSDRTPSAPQNLALTPSHNAVALGWEAPSDDGGSAVTKYQFRVSDDGGSTWTPDWTDIADSGPGGTHSTSYEVNGLDPETEHSFELRAVNANGKGAAVADTATTLRMAVVTEVVILSPAKTYAIGDTIRVKSSFENEVAVVASHTARPYIALEIGGSAKRAYFTMLDNPESPVFSYTVQEGDLDTDGISIAANSLTVPDGSSVISHGVPVALEHAPVGTDPTRKVDGVRPAVSSATASGTQVVVTLSEGLDEGYVPAVPGGFSVTADDSAATVSDLAVTGADVTLTLAAPVRQGQTVTVSYAAPGLGGSGESDGTDPDWLRDLAGNGAESFFDHAVTNTTVRVPNLSVADTQAEEGAALAFRVTLDAPGPEPMSVDWATADGTAEAGADYESARGTLSFAAGETEKTIRVASIDDLEHEQTETLMLALSNPKGARIAVGEATGRITDTDVIPQAWLARFGRTAADQVLKAVKTRLKAPRSPGLEGRIAGVALDPGGSSRGSNAGAMAFRGGPATPTRGARSELGGDDGHTLALHRSPQLSVRDVVTGTSFALTGGSQDGGFSSLWGQAAIAGFDGHEGDLALDGEVRTGMLGADYERGPLAGGLLLSMSRGDGSYGSRGGEIESSLAGVYPYARYAVNDRVSLWGVAGYGRGDVTVTPPEGAPREADIDLRMIAGGTRRTVLEGSGTSGFRLAVESDAMLVRIDSDAAPGLGATESDVTRARLGLEGSWRGLEVNGGTLSPGVEVGLRRDGGDAETGTGVDVGGSLAWLDPGRGIAAKVEARGLLTHANKGFRERGFAGSFAWDPKPSSEFGPSASVHHSVGAAVSRGVEALFDRGAPQAYAEDAPDTGRSRLKGTLGYGLPILGGAFVGTPQLGFGMSEDSRDVSVGYRLATTRGDARELSLDVEGTRRIRAGGPRPDYRIGLRLIMHW